MRRFLIFAVVVSTFVALVIGCASSPPASSATSALSSEPLDPAVADEIRARNATMETLYREGRFRELAAIYADDGLLLGPNGYRVEGRDAIDAYWMRSAEDRDEHDWVLTIHSLEGDASLVIERGTSTLSYTRVSSGERRVSVVEFIVVWRKSAPDAPWKIAVDAYW